jgi:hypothetical protein
MAVDQAGGKALCKTKQQERGMAFSVPAGT